MTDNHALPKASRDRGGASHIFRRLTYLSGSMVDTTLTVGLGHRWMRGSGLGGDNQHKRDGRIWARDDCLCAYLAICTRRAATLHTSP